MIEISINQLALYTSKQGAYKQGTRNSKVHRLVFVQAKRQKTDMRFKQGNNIFPRKLANPVKKKSADKSLNTR